MLSPICSSHALNISIMLFKVYPQPLAIRSGEEPNEAGKKRQNKVREEEGEEDHASEEIKVHGVSLKSLVIADSIDSARSESVCVSIS